MAGKKKYYELDNIGFLGVVETRSAVAIKRDALLTSQVIKKYQAGVISTVKESAVAAYPRKEATVKTAKVATARFSPRKKQHAHSK